MNIPMFRFADVMGDLQSVVANVSHSNSVLKCDMIWLTVLVVSSSIALSFGVIGMIASFSRLGPEPGLNISSLIKDSPYVNHPPISSSALEPGERSRMYSNLIVRYGDVKDEGGIGYIAIGDHGVSKLSPKRMYG